MLLPFLLIQAWAIVTVSSQGPSENPNGVLVEGTLFENFPATFTCSNSQTGRSTALKGDVLQGWIAFPQSIYDQYTHAPLPNTRVPAPGTLYKYGQMNGVDASGPALRVHASWKVDFEVLKANTAIAKMFAKTGDKYDVVRFQSVSYSAVGLNSHQK